MRIKNIEKTGWVSMLDNTLEHQHSTVKKFAQKWFELYMVERASNNATYLLHELDETILRIPMVGKHIKVFWKRDGRFHSNSFDSFITPEATEEDIE